MTEPRALAEARAHLAAAEKNYRTPAGLARLDEGLALLEDLVDAGGGNARVAGNLAAAYANKIYSRIGALVVADPGLPETDCEHLFKVLLAFDRTGVAEPPDAREIKIGLVRRLIDRYYEGHSAQDKERAVQQLMSVARVGR